MNPPAAKRWRKPGLWLVGFIISPVIVGVFYAGENWRGKRTWEDCQRALKTRGVELNWNNYIPAEVPDDENVFGVPEMERWFKGGSAATWSDLTRKLSSPTFPGLNIDSNTTRMVVVGVTIGLPGTSAPDGALVLRWDDPASRATAATSLTTALGPIARAPQSPIGVGLMLRRPEEVPAARIFLQCQTAPTRKDLEEFLPDTIVHADPGLPERVLKFEPDGNSSYRVTMPVLARAADYLAWSDGLEPEFALIRQALLRPSARMHGFYDNPNTVPGPNFRAARNLVQTLGARAQGDLLLDRPGEALRDLTLIHDFCRIFVEHKPMTLLSAMLNAAVSGLYATQVAEGLRLQAWREPELAALEEQLKTVDVLQPVKQAFTLSAVITLHSLESVPSAGMMRRSALAGLCPRGWGYQHIATRVNLDFDRIASFDPAGQVIFPDQVEAAGRKAQALDAGSPFTYAASLTPVNITRACQNTAHYQTEINQALIACALERFRLVRGEYPQSLEALVPQFLDKIPRDVIGGAPPHYRRAADGTFVLYSIGWNGRDNGGVRGKPLPGTDGDWVWPD